jgi:hypothetical protein
MGLWRTIEPCFGGSVKPIEEALKLDPTAILEEIRKRRELAKEMVGQLYPSILATEIEKLYNEYDRRKYSTL